jgi:hypothetical protein
MNQYPENDNEFTEYVIDAVTKGENYYTVSFDGCCFSVPIIPSIEPKVGSIMRQYGPGFGYQVRGCFIDEQKVYYRTEEEQKEANRLELEQSKQVRRDELELHRSEREADFRSLPPEFQARIVRFRRNNPEFQAENEPYEMFCCKEAVKIAMTLGTADAIQAFGKAPIDEQRVLVPNVDFYNHSGNTFGASVRLAWLYVKHSEFVEKEHGALCPLLGCKGYGCVPDGATEYQA